MLQSPLISVLIAAAVVAVLVLLLASTRKPQSGAVPLPSGKTLDEGGSPSGYWMTIGIAAGILGGLALGLVMNAVVGGISVGIGMGLILGKLLTRRFDKDTREYAEEQKLERQRRAGWGLIVMVLLVLATLLAAILPLLD